jgi:hypothetical protein
MSEEFYPLSGIQSIKVKPYTRVETDEFEYGNEATRLLWAEKSFKRKFEVKHAPLVDQEAIVLRDFFSERSGPYDSFWFRDNVNREGNYRVRFASEMDYERITSATEVMSVMNQLSATKSRVTLPRIIAVIAGASGTRDYIPFWFDANKSKHWLHNYVATHEQDWFNAGALAGEDAILQSPGEVTSQVYVNSDKAENCRFIGSTTGKYITANDQVKGDYIAPGSAARGLFFCVVRNPTHSSKSVIMGMGDVSSGNAMGLAINASNQYEPWLGGAHTFTNAKFTNSAVNTWRTIAVAFDGSSCSLYVNGIGIGTDLHVGRTYVDGKLSLGCAPDGTLAVGGAGINYLQHAMYLSDDFDGTVVAALHNLFAAQFGLATV